VSSSSLEPPRDEFLQLLLRVPSRRSSSSSLEFVRGDGIPELEILVHSSSSLVRTNGEIREVLEIQIDDGFVLLRLDDGRCVGERPSLDLRSRLDGRSFGFGGLGDVDGSSKEGFDASEEAVRWRKVEKESGLERRP